MKGTLFVCATPIGNLSDATYRLIDTLKQVALIASEDTRVIQKLLIRYEIPFPKLKSLHAGNEAGQIASIIQCLNEGHQVALVSDAGTPGICDPGYRLVHVVREQGFSVVPIPGPSAVTTLLSVAGLPVDQFYFGGFLPRKESEIHTFLESLRILKVPIVVYEAPHRLIKTLHILANCPVDYLVVGKELSKKFEKVMVGSPDAIVQQMSEEVIKGEWVLVVTLLPTQATHEWHHWVEAMKQAGISKKEIVAVAKMQKLSRNEVYAYLEGG